MRHPPVGILTRGRILLHALHQQWHQTTPRPERSATHRCHVSENVRHRLRMAPRLSPHAGRRSGCGNGLAGTAIQRVANGRRERCTGGAPSVLRSSVISQWSRNSNLEHFKRVIDAASLPWLHRLQHHAPLTISPFHLENSYGTFSLRKK